MTESGRRAAPGGRRRSSQADRLTGPVAAAGVAVMLAVAALVVQVLGGSGAGSIEPITDEVRTAELACPAPVVTGKTADTQVTVVAPPTDSGKAAGSATLADLDKPDQGRARLATPGRVDVRAGNPLLPAQVARGTADLAPGLAAEVLTDVNSGSSRGLAAVSCAAAGVSAWFVGASTAAGRRDRLVMTNPEGTAALVNLRFWNENGPVEAPPNSTGIDVPAAAVVAIPLDGMTAGHQRLAIEVRALRGRVAAAVHDIDAPGIAARGIDWIAPAVAPARTIVIPGLADGKLGRRLQIFTPGDIDAIVKIRLLTADNSFAPAGLDTIELPARRVADFDLGKAAGTAAAAILVTADRPIVAAVRVTRADKKVADVAYATAATALTTPSTLPIGRGPQGSSTRLILAAPRGDAELTLTLVLPTGAGPPTTVRIPAGRIVVVDPAPKGGVAYSVVITPGQSSGPIYAARILRVGATDLTITPLVPGRFTVAIPGIEPDLTAVLP